MSCMFYGRDRLNLGMLAGRGLCGGLNYCCTRDILLGIYMSCNFNYKDYTF